jgi:hypothetical protein
MADEPASRFFREPGKGFMATLIPSIFYHELYNHSYMEIARYLHDIDGSDVSDNRKKYEKEVAFNVVKTSRIYNSKAFIVIASIIISITLIFASYGMYNTFQLSLIILIFIISILNYIYLSDNEANSYINNFNAAHDRHHGKSNETSSLDFQEHSDYPNKTRLRNSSGWRITIR